nr:MAG TPA: hypothetical protein [Caudoviricetes sp.]
MDNEALVRELWKTNSFVAYWADCLNGHLLRSGVRDSHDADGDWLGDSHEASMVRVHARAALGAMRHLASSLENLATKLDPDTSEN